MSDECSFRMKQCAHMNSYTPLGEHVHERKIQQVSERGRQLFMLVSDPQRRNGELLTAPVGKPARTTVMPHTGSTC